MATSTSNLNLILPDYSDKADISVLNDNFQKIDEYCANGGVSNEDLQNAVKAANAWANATASAESVSADREADVNLTDGDNSKNLHFSIPRGQPGVLISETEPTDPNVKVWIKPDGEPNELEHLKSDVSSLKDHYAASSNLVNLSTVTRGFYIGTDGTINESTSYVISDYIPVDGSKAYIGNNLVSIACYKQDKSFIARYYVTNNKKFTLPAATCWLRISSNILPRRWSLNEGDVLYPYDEYYKFLDGIRLPYTATASKDGIIFSGDIDRMFSLNNSPVVDFGSYTGIKADAVYAMYDSLASQYPSYITKDVLGEDAFGNEIAAYRMTPARATVKLSGAMYESDRVKAKIPTILITCGMHGNEHSSALVTYLMFRQMCEQTDNEQVNVLRHDVNFIVIPVANPSGWNAYTRKNAAGIDLNRNFENGFTVEPVGSSVYGGDSPLSQPETQYIRRILDENDIDISVDFHETASGNAASANDICWVSAGKVYDMHIAQSFCERISRKFKSEYDWAGAVNDLHGYVEYGFYKGTLEGEAVASGCKFSTTFEIISKWQLYEGAKAFDEIHAKTAVECLGEYLLSILRQLRREYHQMSDYLMS